MYALGKNYKMYIYYFLFKKKKKPSLNLSVPCKVFLFGFQLPPNKVLVQLSCLWMVSLRNHQMYIKKKRVLSEGYLTLACFGYLLLHSIYTQI